jgi:hypothetical protein
MSTVALYRAPLVPSVDKGSLQGSLKVTRARQLVEFTRPQSDLTLRTCPVASAVRRQILVLGPERRFARALAPGPRSFGVTDTDTVNTRTWRRPKRRCRDSKATTRSCSIAMLYVLSRCHGLEV